MDPETLANEIIQSKKYSDVDRSLVLRLCSQTLPKYQKWRDAQKAVKKELHIINASYVADCGYNKAGELLDGYEMDAPFSKATAMRLLLLHASTRERASQADEIYAYISGFFSMDDTIIDIGCGFNPFALPLYAAPPKRYIALDISATTVGLLNRFFAMAGLSNRYKASVLDAVASSPDARGDTLFLFKVFPLFERQKKGRTFALMHECSCPVSIVSFPTKSASGKQKGMEAFYSGLFESGLPTEFHIIDKASFENEIFYVVGKAVGKIAAKP